VFNFCSAFLTDNQIFICRVTVYMHTIDGWVCSMWNSVEWTEETRPSRILRNCHTVIVIILCSFVTVVFTFSQKLPDFCVLLLLSFFGPGYLQRWHCSVISISSQEIININIFFWFCAKPMFFYLVGTSDSMILSQYLLFDTVFVFLCHDIVVA